MLKEAKKIFVVGIGGIGLSALARLLKQSGKQVSGSDLEDSEIVGDLRKEGIKINIPQRQENLPDDSDLLIFSAAIPEDNPERAKAKKNGIPQISYPQALGEFVAKKRVIAVAGTNGKTTTSAMIGWILEQAGIDPMVIVGSKVLAWNSNARAGKGEWVVLEADEYRRAFLNYSPDIGVITNIELDHLDYFKDLQDIKSAFLEFANKIKPGGLLLYNMDNYNSYFVVDNYSGNKSGYSITKFKFLWWDVKDKKRFYNLKIPGIFNQENAMAAAVACAEIGVDRDTIKKALESFTGTWRRFQRIGKLGKTEIISDYAHHPDGVTVVLDTIASLYAGKRVLAVFQPHQRNRTKRLFPQFVVAFCGAELHNFIIAEIFDVAGRERAEDADISSAALVAEINKCGKHADYARNLDELEQKVRDVAEIYDVIIFMGAGDIYKVAEKLAK